MKIRMLIYIIIALVLFLLGFIIGKNSNMFTKSFDGTYRTNSWNGKEEAFLILNKDYSCIYPTGSKCTWLVDDDIIYFEIKNTYSYADGEIHTVESLDKYEAIIVDKGVMLHNQFFEKVK